jgi:hypothetical protein
MQSRDRNTEWAQKILHFRNDTEKDTAYLELHTLTSR